MKKRVFLLFPLVVLLFFGSSIIPVRAASVNDPQDDLIGIHTWEEDEEQDVDCDYIPTEYYYVDIKSIEWLEVGDNYTVTITFWGTPDQAKIESGDVAVLLMFLINGSAFPEDLESESPDAHFYLAGSSGSVQANNTYEYDVMTYVGDGIVWNFNKSIAPVAPVALESWDVIAMASYSYEQTVGTVEHSYIMLDHYNFLYMETALKAICAILDIPGYSLIIVGVVAVVTIGFIIKRQLKK